MDDQETKETLAKTKEILKKISAEIEQSRRTLAGWGANIEEVCDSGITSWYVNTKNANRTINFCFDGLISLTKNARKPNERYKTNPTYEATYDVLTKDFSIMADHKMLIENGKKRKEYKKYSYQIAREGHTIFLANNNIQVEQNLFTNQRKYIIRNIKTTLGKPVTVILNSTPDNTGQLEKLGIDIVTYKGSGKINGKYRLRANKNNKVQAEFLSRKGRKINIIDKAPALFGGFTQLQLSKSEKSGIPTKKEEVKPNKNKPQTIEKKEQFRMIELDMKDFDLKLYQNNLLEIIDFFHSIKGELPLLGLENRLINCLGKLTPPKTKLKQKKAKVKRILT